jgi:mono/diheme cytochrome c family protein
MVTHTTSNRHGTLARTIGLVVLTIILLILLSACRGERVGDVAEEALVSGGRASFQAYCASCHGHDGEGDGPVAAKMTAPPTNLTTLAQRHGGEFPRDYVEQTIDGRAGLEAHGTTAMPVWGRVWRANPSDPQSEVEAERILNELIHYIESIQTTS